MVLLDTFAVIWLAESDRPTMLSQNAISAIAAARRQDGVAISVVTLYELSWLMKSNRIPVSTTNDAFLDEVESLFAVVPASPAIARLAMEFPASYPKDPMDRIIGATALDRRVRLVTSDRAIRSSKAVPVVW
jgi:PIN domain nuclease of toxin-antitoxin system